MGSGKSRENGYMVLSIVIKEGEGGVRDGIKPCEMKKRRLLFATKVAGGSYMCEGGRKEKGGKGQYVPSRTVAHSKTSQPLCQCASPQAPNHASHSFSARPPSLID